MACVLPWCTYSQAPLCILLVGPHQPVQVLPYPLPHPQAEMQALRGLCAEQHLLQVEIGELRQEIVEFKQGVTEQVDSILAYSGSRDTTYWGGLKPSQVTANPPRMELVDDLNITVQPARVGVVPSRQGKAGSEGSGKQSLPKEEAPPPVPEKKRKQQTG